MYITEFQTISEVRGNSMQQKPVSIKEKDIVVVYVDGEKALSNRIYSAVGASWRMRFQGAKADNIKIYGK